MKLYLLSMPGAYPIQDILAASKPYLKAQPGPTLLYLPAAGSTLKSEYVDLTQTVFEGLAMVEILDLTRPLPFVNIENALERAAVLLSLVAKS